jgi:hypothetical protein
MKLLANFDSKEKLSLDSYFRDRLAEAVFRARTMSAALGACEGFLGQHC